MPLTPDMMEKFKQMEADGAYAATITTLMCFQHGLLELHAKGDGPFSRHDLVEAFGGLPLDQLAAKIGEIPMVKAIGTEAPSLTIDKVRQAMSEQGDLEKRRKAATEALKAAGAKFVKGGKMTRGWWLGERYLAMESLEALAMLKG